MFDNRAWGALLSGHVLDLQDWRETLLPPHAPWAEQWIINNTPRLVLRSSDFDQFEDSLAVWNAAKLLTTRLNGAFAAHSNAEPLSVEGIAERRSDGTIGQHAIFAVGAAHARARAGSLSASAQIGPTAVQRWIELADQSDLVDDLLIHQSGEPNWYNLYKAFEVIRQLCGGQRALEQRPWCPPELSRFTHTANIYRHSSAHPSHNNPPATPMSLSEAMNIIRAMTNEAMKEQLDKA
jgi:hypothetical protein